MSKINWIDGLNLERDCAIILREQEENGVYFDIELAKDLIARLDHLKEEQEAIIRPNIKPIVNKLGTTVSKIFLKNGDYNSSILKHYPDDYFIVEAPFSRIEIIDPDISQRKVLVDQLLSKGWKPTLFTEKGFPKLTDKGEPVESLLRVGNFGKALSTWYVLSHRQSQIQGFLPHVREDHRIPAAGIVVGTNTFRMTHKYVVNIPRVGSIFGSEMRSLFKAEPGKKIVTVDLSGIELRLLAHYMNDDEYIDQVLNGDIHSYNQQKAGLSTRNQAKSMIYCWLYGGGNAKLGSVVGGSAKDGERIKSTFLKEIPALGTLLNKVKSFIEKNGYIPSLDKRKVYIRSYEGKLLIHTGLNTLLQSGGSIVAKRFMVINYNELKKQNIPFKQILFMHDEISIECDVEDTEKIKQIMLDSVKKAGEYYNLRIRLDGEGKIGNNWSETH